MSSMQQIAVALTGPAQTKKVKSLALPEIQAVIAAPQHDMFAAITGLPGADIVKQPPESNLL